MNRFESYLKDAKAARMHLNEAGLAIEKGDAKRALRNMNSAMGLLLVAMNNFSHLYFKPRKKSPVARKKAKPAAIVLQPLLHVMGDFPSDKRNPVFGQVENLKDVGLL